MPLRLLPVLALTLASALVASCSKQAETPPAAAAPAAPAASTQPSQTGGQTTNFEENTQTQAPAAAPAPTS
jgi:hypothetical protein